MTECLYKRIARAVVAMDNCRNSNNTEWLQRHRESVHKLTKEHMPSGSGVDNGTQFNAEKSTGNKIVFHADFHHMNNHGMYDGWTEHDVIVTPSLAFSFELKITGRNRDDIKEYLHELFASALRQSVPSE